MAVIRPFKAVRPLDKVAHLVASVPYDVVSREEAAELAKGNPISFLRITRSEIELDQNINPYSEEVYKKAAENFKRLRDEAPLIQEDKASFYIYKLVMGKQEQVGIAATFSSEDYDNDVIMKHEKTRKVKEDDRTNHIINTEAQTGAVFLTYKGVAEVNEVVGKTMETNPIYEFTAPDEIKHTIWVMPEEYNETVINEIASVKNLYIADGHHRAASASRAQKVKKETNPSHNGTEEYNYFLAVLFPAEELKILPYNRVVIDLKGKSTDDVINDVKQYFDVRTCDFASPKEHKSICMYLAKTWYLLKPNSRVVPGDSVGEKLDVSILQNFLLTPVFGIEDVRTDTNIDFIGGIRGTEELEKLVESGKASVAFSMYPVEVQDLINISDAGETMPPKSTWFEPKLRDGLVIHTI